MLCLWRFQGSGSALASWVSPVKATGPKLTNPTLNVSSKLAIPYTTVDDINPALP